MSVIETGNAALPRMPLGFMVVSTEELLISTDNSAPSYIKNMVFETPTTKFAISDEFNAIINKSNKHILYMGGIVSYILNNNNNAAAKVMFFSETSEDKGVTWQSNLLSGRSVGLKNNSGVYNSTSSEMFNFKIGSMLRFGFLSDSANITMGSGDDIILNGEIVESPSFRWRLSEF